MARSGEPEGAHSPSIELEEIARDIRSSFHLTGSVSRRSSSIGSAREGDDEYELQWAAIERLSTTKRVTTSVLDCAGNGDHEKLERKVVDVAKLGALERRLLMEKLIKHIEKDNLRLLQKQRERMDR